MATTQKVDKALMRKSNMRLVFSSILEQGETSKARLAELTGMSVVSVGRIAEELMAMGLVQENRREAGGSPGAGRPPAVLSLAADQLLCCGAALDWRVLHLGLTDPAGGLREQESHAFPQEEDFTPQRVIPWMAGLLEAYLTRSRPLQPQRVVGVVLPGIVDVDRGEVQFSANFRWNGVPVAELFQAQLPDYRFVLENDAKAVAVAEHCFGALAGCRDLVYLSIGNGIGAAAILNGELHRGKDNKAGEIGHIVLNPSGKLCECGQVGCLQTNLARLAILTEARSVYPNITLQGLLERYGLGDHFAVALLERVADYVCMAIHLLANTYSPEAVLLGGSLFREGPVIWELVEERSRRRPKGFLRDSFILAFERFGETGPVIGGGALAFRQVLEELFERER